MSMISKQHRPYAYLFVGPLVVSFIIFFVIAFLRTAYFSFTDYDLFNEPKWVGLDNYIQLLTEDLFLTALTNSVAYMVIVTVIQISLALVIAVLLNQKLRGILVFRTAYYFPSILSSAAVTLVFMWIYQRTGFLNFAIGWFLKYYPVLLTFVGLFAGLQLLQFLWERRQDPEVKWHDPALGLISLIGSLVLLWLVVGMDWITANEAVKVEMVWLNTRQTFLGLPVTLWAIIIQNIYTTVPTLMLMFLAGLQDIPKTVYEAATLDGANPLQQFLFITVPMLRPVLFLVLTLSLIGTLQLFDQVALLGTAAPLESRITLAYYVFNSAFPAGGTPNVGLGSAAAIVLAGLTLVVVYLQRLIGISEGGVK